MDLTWDRPTDVRVSGHVVEYQAFGDTSWTNGPEVTEMNRVTVPGVAGTRYKYRVASTDNSDRRSAWGTYCLLGWGGQVGTSLPAQYQLGALANNAVTKITAGQGHTCALLSNFTVACWGSGKLGNGSSLFFSTPVAVAGGALAGKTVVAVSAGENHTCAVIADGTAACWGQNSYGQLGDGTNVSSIIPVAVAGGALVGKTVIAISAAQNYTCAVLSDGAAACWGSNASGQLGNGNNVDSNVPVAVAGGALAGKTVAKLSTGGASKGVGGGHTCAVLSDGAASCWGDNIMGQLGNNSDVDSNVPISISDGALAGKTVTDISTGGSHTCAILSDETAACWGDNSMWQLGNGSNAATSRVPVSISGGAVSGKRVSKIATGLGHTCVLLSDGSAACWGENSGGQLGDGTNVNSNIPVSVSGGELAGKDASEITTGTYYTCAVISDGTAACWGQNSRGQLGNDNAGNSNRPSAVSTGVVAGKTVTNIDAGDQHTCAVLSDRTVACWGNNDYGQSGSFTSDTPASVTNGALAGKSVINITTGAWHSCALMSDGTAACWGEGSHGQLGSSTYRSNVPVAVTGGALAGKTVIAISAGQNYTCAVLSDGTAACWGQNSYGQLGNGSNLNSNAPVAITGGALAGKTVIAISAAQDHTCAALSDGTAACWGQNSYGQLGNGSNLNSNAPVAITGGAVAGKSVTALSGGEKHTCALTSDGTAACWGGNGSGQLGNSTYAESYVPVAVSGRVLASKSVIGIASAGFSTCAVLSDNTVACWGNNESGQLGLGTNSDTYRPSAIYGFGFTIIESRYNNVVGLSDGSFRVSNGQAANESSDKPILNTVVPSRIMDTRDGTGGVAVGKVGNGRDDSGAVLEFSVLGKGTLPSSAAAIGAVSMNVTVTGTSVGDEGGWVAVFPCGTSPGVSNLNFVAGQTIPNAVITPVSSDGKVCFKVYGKANLIADINGYFTPSSGFNTVVPSRIMDTRDGTGGVAVGKVGNGRDDSGAVLEFSVLGKGTLPSSAAAIGAVSMNVTVTGTSVGDEGGWVAVFPCGTSPGVSNLNFVAGQTIPNAVITPVSSDGKVCFKVYGKANLIADINGYFTPSSGFNTVVPSRIMDTRNGTGLPLPWDITGGYLSGGYIIGVTPDDSNGVLEFSVLGKGTLPSLSIGIDAVSINVTVADTRAADEGGWVAVFPCGTLPGVSNLNFVSGQTIPNAVITPVSSDGKVCFKVYGLTSLIVDINGYFTKWF